MYNLGHSSFSSNTDSSGSAGRHTLWQHAPEMVTVPGPNAFRFHTGPNQSSTRLPQSRSEGNVRSLDTSGRDSESFAGNYFHQWYPSASYYPEHHEDQYENMESARGRHRSTSPVKVLEDVDEYEELAYTSTPPPRSRSPHKKLFGENGWLGKTPTIDKQKKPGLKALGEKIKQRVEDMTGDVMKTTSTAFQSRSAPTMSTCPISLDPPTQAKLYSEMELMICVTANKFLMDQYRDGRMSSESVTKVISFWTSKNRPQVVQFQFDQATQRDLILYNIKNFGFHGECARDSVVLNATLYNWKIIAKEMNVRTFCYPDSVIRKHMHDTHKLLEMLGAPCVTFLAFQELQVNALSLMKQEQERKVNTHREHGITKAHRPRTLSREE
ncbi:hypothetical protein LOZ53_006074 [Ophidiomyces ophidiicola]|nr:hypothetical protein LOZ55_000545 [Ophidiomyces ophidiicola]KAI1982210.1 hypothetical protein LOZ54_005398 [Ophidiomyces ophidiicola]KAI1982965.1 hypothetical protein LOZ53_006074 [Ophidiomyces ophidiicola]KAI1989407.1 hypothetical protein LOZ51_005220 [Ophidiomyces ophidiicola]